MTLGHEQMRADARANRERILDIAHDAFAASPTVSLNAIAQRAGVGAGTLYRHFPTREALILAVYQHDVEILVDSVPRLLAEHEPLDALRIWFERLADYVRIKHGLGEALNTVDGSVDEHKKTMAEQVEAAKHRKKSAERVGVGSER